MYHNFPWAYVTTHEIPTVILESNMVNLAVQNKGKPMEMSSNYIWTCFRVWVLENDPYTQTNNQCVKNDDFFWSEGTSCSVDNLIP